MDECLFDSFRNFGRNIVNVAVAGRLRLFRKSLGLEAGHATKTSLALCRLVSKSDHRRQLSLLDGQAPQHGAKHQLFYQDLCRPPGQNLAVRPRPRPASRQAL